MWVVPRELVKPLVPYRDEGRFRFSGSRCPWGLVKHETLGGMVRLRAMAEFSGHAWPEDGPCHPEPDG